MSDESPDRASSDGERPDSRQAALAIAAVLALVLAAFAAPAANATVGPFDPGPSDGTTPDRSDQDGGDNEYGIPVLNFFDDILEWLLPFITRPTEDSPSHQCTIILEGDRFPGSTVTARITYDGEPLADAPVWFNDRRVGRTDANGTVSGRVPYEKELVVKVRVENRPDCRTSRVSLDRSDRSGAEATAAVSTARTTASVAAGALSPVGVAAAQESSSEPTASYPVDATATVSVLGEPLPGSTVTVVAQLDDRPFPNASLSVNGEPSGRTDESGRARIPVPADGTEQLRVRVSRGEFSASETVDVLLLQVQLEPTGLAVVPGATAAVNVTYGGDQLEGARVSVAGDPRGVTGTDGYRRVDLPFDPTAPVVVRAQDQTASTSVAAVYDAPLALLGGVLAALCVLVYREWGTSGVLGVVWTVASLVAVVVADAFYGRTGRYAVLAAVTTVTVAYAAYRVRSDLEAGSAATAGLLRRLASRLRVVVGRLLAIATTLRTLPGSLGTLAGVVRERLLAATVVAARALEALVDSLRSLPRSGRELAALLVTHLRTVVLRAHAALRAVSTASAVALLVAFAVVVATDVLLGRDAAVVAFTVLAVAALGLLTYRLRASVTADESDDATDGSIPGRVGTDPGVSTLRELWRAFARVVVPDAWRTRTPSEVARAAVDQGYPREPVEAFTELFREVEYGRRSLSAAVRDRARTAYAAIRARDREDEP